MAALFLRLLMILSLALNGAGAPLAMAGGPPPSTSPSLQQASAPSPAGGCEKHLAAPSEARAVMASHGDSVPREAASDCCDGPGCHCGCTLPPLIHGGGPLGLAAPPFAARAAASLPMDGAGHGHPPYRPPTG
jgi:hypothetical protein